MSPRRCGLALVVVIGVLAVLAVLAVTFATMAQLERRASAQRTQAAKALLLARSGIEDALARLAMGMDPEATSSRYAGEDLNGNGALDPGVEVQAQAYRPSALDRDACPARHALRPSFFVRDPAGSPALATVEGRARGYSGFLGADRAPQGNQYAVKALGEDGLYVNGGDLTGPGMHPGTYDLVLRTILHNLGNSVGLAGASRLVLERPAGGWISMEQARTALGWTRSQADLISPYLAFHAWVDRKVVVPNRLWGSGVLDSNAAWATQRPRFNAATSSYAPDFERDSAGSIVGRSPVNINWARDKPQLLRWLLYWLKGTCLRATNAAGLWNAEEVSLDPGDVDRVLAAFGALGPSTAYANYPHWDGTWTLDSWEEFNRFVDEKVLPSGTSDLVRLKRDLLKAAFNPNTDSNKCNPNLTMWRAADKSDVAWNPLGTDLSPTELCFRTPVTRLESLGRVLDGRGRLLAERMMEASVILDQLRLTAQSEFVCADLGRLDVAGDERDPRYPGEAWFITAARATPAAERPWGTKCGSVSIMDGQMLSGSDENGQPFINGLTLQTYPEPQWPSRLPLPTVYDRTCPPAACWDGSLQLASLGTGYNVTYGVAGADMRFLASWERGLDAEQAGGSPWGFSFAPSGALLTDAYPDTAHSGCQAASVLGASSGSDTVNVLYPDGLYTENRRTPAYLADGNLPPRQGTISFWVKPACAVDYTPSSSKLDNLGRMPIYVNLSLLPSTANPDRTQMFLITGTNAVGTANMLNAPVPLKAYYAGYHESGFRPSDSHDRSGSHFDEHITSKPARCPTGPDSRRQGGNRQWHLLTYQWNLDAPDLAGAHRMTVDADATSTGVIYHPDYLWSSMAPPDPGWASDLTGNTALSFLDNTQTSNLLYLGATLSGADCIRGVAKGAYGFRAANATFDEFAVYDLGTDMAKGQALAQARFAAGRYYKPFYDPADPQREAKESRDARWTSTVITLPPGSRIAGLDRTLILPEVDPLSPADDPNRIFYGTGAALATGRTADALIEVRSATGALLPPRALLPDGRIRISATIRSGLWDNDVAWSGPAAPLLESPVLDDITLSYTPATGPRVLAWGSP